MKNLTNPPALVDAFGREVNYLRISVTDLCNLRCTYCMPVGGVEKLPREAILTFEEIFEVVEVGCALGISTVRITGGEPLIRPGIVALIGKIARMPGIQAVNMTTNGILLAKHALSLKQAGLQRVNVSLDTLDPDAFARITRGGELTAVLRGIDEALAVGLAVKLNAVLVDGLQRDVLDSFIAYAQQKKVELRFIERMGFEDEGEFVTEKTLVDLLRETYAVQKIDDPAGSHVRKYLCDDVQIGIISPRTHSFCAGCNKLRITPEGRIKVCLSSEASVDVKQVLRSPHRFEDIAQVFYDAIQLKPENGPWTARGEMWRVGG